MDTQRERLGALIDFAKQTALLRKTPVANITQHKEFHRVEDRIKGLPGVTFNCQENEFAEVWLRMERLHESRPPTPKNELLNAWIDLQRPPTKEPALKNHVVRQALVDIGALPAPEAEEPAEAAAPGGEQLTISLEKTESALVTLEEFTDRERVKGLLKAYIESVWRPWAEHEKEVRKSITLYSELFMLSQKMQGNLVDSQLELVWGIGMGVWASPTGTICYPLLTQLLEISVDEKTMALEIRPRSAEARLEVDIYAAMDNSGVAPLVEAWKSFCKSSGTSLSPFESSTFEPLLRSAASLLDASGVYWPTQTTDDDRSVPKAVENLLVTDTWALMARPRNTSIFVQDLERFSERLAADGETKLPDALLALVTDPADEHVDQVLPAFRGLSVAGGSGDSAGSASGSVAELYFPEPYNDEQVQIVQMLEANDGVVVQGPPGTGKTHTIANVICHYLALGKRVLVTSMKDPALAVLQEKLPDSIRPLAISLLTSEAEGMQQFEFSVNKISAEVTRIDRTVYRREIEQIDGQINTLHVHISKADRDIASWARMNLDNIVIDDESLTPLEAARQVAAGWSEVTWFPDALGVEAVYKPQFGNNDVTALRDARRTVGVDMGYLGKRVPQIGEFPETRRLLQVHVDLSRLSELKAQEADGVVPGLASTAPETIETAITASAMVSSLRLILKEIDDAQQAWTGDMQQYIRRTSKSEILDLLNALGGEIAAALETRTQFLSKPVNIPDGLDSNPELVQAIDNLAQGKKPFGIAGMFGKSDQKRALEKVVILIEKPATDEDWGHVLSYVKFLQLSRALLVRWNTLADELPLPRLDVRPEQVIAAGSAFALYQKLVVSIKDEADVVAAVQPLLPAWAKAGQTPYSRELLNEAESILQHHLTRHRLADTWVVKESFLKALSGCEGEISEQLADFLHNRLGNPSVSESDIQAQWSKLMQELRRIIDLSSSLKTIASVTAVIEASGAVKWADMLRNSHQNGPVDALLPDNWAQAWRLCRILTFVEKIDGRQELKRLSKMRTEYEKDLSKAYKEAINKRTWLRLSENATPGVRAALEAYRSAIRKIGKGTGVRAGRYRQDARLAADRANSAIPCWIMPHYRICESLPASFGCFDLVIIDEASQSDLTALPALLRAKKVLVVGDDKQVSPEGVGLEEEKIRSLMTRFLTKQVDIYRAQMTPDRSIYDLFKVVFAKSSVMLREHFRCVAPIIEYSKREFYNHELRPLRIPKASQRLDPPLVDVYLTDGCRDKDINLPEARFIVDEIKSIVANPALQKRSIGVVSLLGNEQALRIMQMLNEELGEQIVTQYKITCGDARTFQGKERDIMFLSMVASPGQAHAQTQDAVAQRFNVAASRARDRMYLVRSITLEELSPADRLRAKLIEHFQAPFLQNEEELTSHRDRCESPFEREVFDFLVERGYRVVPQVPVGAYRIDMVVEGEGDSRIAIECDGDRYHGPAQWDSDMRRQRILERAGWHFWRCFASTFVLHNDEVKRELIETLESHDIRPGLDPAANSIHVESRKVAAFASVEKQVADLLTAHVERQETEEAADDVA